MRARIDAKAFAKAVSTVAPFAARFSHVIACSSILVEVRGDDMVLTGGDVETFCRTTVDITATTTHEPGLALVPADFLARAAANVDGDVDLELADMVLGVSDASTSYSIRCGDPLTYPAVDWAAVEPEPLGDLRGAVASVMHAASSDGARQVLTGIHFGDGRIEATDSYRAAWVVVAGTRDALVPATAFRRAFKLLDDNIAVGFGAGVAIFTDEATTIVTRLIDGDYIANLPAAGPKATTWSIEVSCSELTQAISAVAAVPGVVTKVGSNVRFAVEGAGTLNVHATARDVGDGSAIIKAAIDGNFPPLIAYNPSYLLDAIAVVEGDSVVIAGGNDKTPCIIRSGDLTQVIFPVRIP